jgi:ATP-dependent RNA helicase DeaD
MFGLVFCRTRRDAKEFADKLMADGYNADALHGDLSQAQRDSVMNKFRNRTLQVLVATDVAARGIDVDDITHVFHVDLPDEIESYTHRAGRTARAGKSGISVALVSPSKAGRVKLVEKQIGKKMDLVKAPTGNDICGQQIIQLIQNVHDIEINTKGIAPYVDKINQELSAFSKEELIQRFVSVEFNRFLKAYEKAGDINLEPRGSRRGDERGERDDRRSGRREDRMSEGTQNSKRVFINVGKLDGFENKGQILGFICNQSGIDGNSVGKIDLFDSFAFLGVEDGVGEKLIQAMNGKTIEKREIRVEFSQDKPRGESRDSREPRSEYRGGSRSSGGDRSGGGDRNRSDRDRGPKKNFSSSNSGGANARNFRERRPR